MIRVLYFYVVWYENRENENQVKFNKKEKPNIYECL